MSLDLLMGFSQVEMTIQKLNYSNKWEFINHSKGLNFVNRSALDGNVYEKCAILRNVETFYFVYIDDVLV